MKVSKPGSKPTALISRGGFCLKKLRKVRHECGCARARRWRVERGEEVWLRPERAKAGEDRPWEETRRRRHTLRDDRLDRIVVLFYREAFELWDKY